MSSVPLLLLIALAASYASGQTSTTHATRPHSGVPASCAVTEPPPTPYIPPPPFDKTKLHPHSFWMGTDRLFTVFNDEMTWLWEPRAPGHQNDEYPRTTKLFFYRAGYNPYLENFPKLKITGRRLDGPAPRLFVDEAGNALGPDGSGAMVTAFYVPSPGCWEITGDYNGDTLSFVVWVASAREVAQSRSK
jgi:hypothetical protein